MKWQMLIIYIMFGNTDAFIELGIIIILSHSKPWTTTAWVYNVVKLKLNINQKLNIYVVLQFSQNWTTYLYSYEIDFVVMC